MTKEQRLKKAIEIAQKSIYDSAVYLGRWNGYNVFEPTFTDDKEHIIGIPQYILEWNGTFRWTNNTAVSFAIMDAFPSKE